MREIEKVCVVGAGAIGSLLVGHLGNVTDMAVLARRDEHAKALNDEGLRVSGKSELHTKVRAATDAAELGEVDLVIIASKALAVEACAQLIDGHFPNAHVLMIQNGLGCEERVSRFGDWPIISGVTFMSGTRHSDTHVEYELDTATWMGPWAGGSATYEYVRQVEELFIRSGLKAEAYEDLLPHQWSKLIFNSAVNSISALTDLPHVRAFAVQDNLEDLGHLVRAMMDEAKRIATARGVTLADDPWVMNVRAVNQGATSGEDYAHIPSMLDDVRSKRLTEIDWITGAIVREAHKTGIPAPYHETLYRLVKAREQGYG
ncbi:MAG: 2-dehydropantoate 2-reductase [Gammaproteobacteria bacterium]|nr:2-dehydropantoate 2-reductase [Gammaproteobacteria bacterium]MCY4210649.1 2-dehydropantoate 2-reductase [Gammaproteobacteria bacterium]MCY4283424.1 2-dehydropantoate 2-reductase [Gammaproteobacteria bacterium]MCY4337287.1 2-dehydropantoate 2-reductase [Gammaproteobacteria bacterium]